MQIHGIGIWTKIFDKWKEELKDHWNEPIFLQVYPDAKGACNPKEHHPSAAFETTIGGAFEYLLQNRVQFGFGGEAP